MATRTKQRKTALKDEVINVRCTREQKQRLSDAARSLGLGLSGWLLSTGLREAAKTENDPAR